MTNYISQSFIGAWIFFLFGLSLAPYCGYAVNLLIGVLIVSAQMIFCKWSLDTHKQDPLEGLWHKLTWIGQK